MSTQKELTDLKDLVNRKPKEFEKATQGVKQAFEVVELNNQWKLNNYFAFATKLNRMIDPDTDFIVEDESNAVRSSTAETIAI